MLIHAVFKKRHNDLQKIFIYLVLSLCKNKWPLLFSNLIFQPLSLSHLLSLSSICSFVTQPPPLPPTHTHTPQSVSEALLLCPEGLIKALWWSGTIPHLSLYTANSSVRTNASIRLIFVRCLFILTHVYTITQLYSLQVWLYHGIPAHHYRQKAPVQAV